MKKIKAYDAITVIGLLVVLYGFSIAQLLLPDREFSEEENRYLQQLPELTLDNLLSGKLSAQLADYYSDQMPLRGLFVGTKAASEMVSGKFENNSVLLGSDGYLIAKEDYVDYGELDKNLAAVRRFSEILGEEHVLRVAIAGRSQDVLTAYAPTLYPAEEVSDRLFEYAASELGGVQTVELLKPLRDLADAGEYVYYRTDHHWTTLGAYYAYAELMRSYGLEPYPLEHYTREQVSDEFYGTTWSKAGMKWIKPDSMQYFRWNGDDDMQVEIFDSGKLISGMYERSYLDGKDKYSSFIGGNNGHVRISRADGAKRETLVLIKDSFGHSLAPFLAEHFDLEIIDLRYYRLPVLELIAESGATRVLVLYNMDSVVSSNSLSMLTLGAK